MLLSTFARRRGLCTTARPLFRIPKQDVLTPTTAAAARRGASRKLLVRDLELTVHSGERWAIVAAAAAAPKEKPVAGAAGLLPKASGAAAAGAATGAAAGAAAAWPKEKPDPAPKEKPLDALTAAAGLSSSEEAREGGGRTGWRGG